MRILLDESLPVELALEISGHDVISVQQMGWSGLKNGELLARCASPDRAAPTNIGVADGIRTHDNRNHNPGI